MSFRIAVGNEWFFLESKIVLKKKEEKYVEGETMKTNWAKMASRPFI